LLCNLIDICYCTSFDYLTSLCCPGFLQIQHFSLSWHWSKVLQLDMVYGGSLSTVGKGKQMIPYLYRKDLWWKLSYQERTNLFLGFGRIRKEWDMATENVLTVVVCNIAICWSLAPSWSYGSTFKYKFQNTIQKIPINVFDKSHPLREFYVQKRIYSFFYKAAELSLVGMVSGIAGAGRARLMPSSRN
jgi:hypothetical protein